jgi:GWxTD domain-containing protein
MLKTLIFTFLFTTSMQAISQDSSYEQGMDFLDEGNVKEALNHWIKARDSLKSINEADFRIGAKFIEVTVQSENKSLYPLATEIYMWGLQQQDIEPIENELISEVNRLQYIISEDQYEEWIQFIENHNPIILIQIKEFWQNADPVFGSSMNERLIEHWERIWHARKNFTQGNHTAFGTDDRGMIYLKYGEPDKIETGSFNLDNSRIQFFSREVLRQQEEEVDIMGQDQASRRTGGVMTQAINDYYMDNLSKSITDRVVSYGISNKYEIWVYKNEKVNLPENLIFIFGSDASTGRFGLVQSPENFIPLNAYRVQSIRNSGYQYNVGPLLQLSLYNDLKFTDDRFLDIYNELFDYLMSSESIVTDGASTYLASKYADELSAMRNAAPENLSLYDLELDNIDLDYKSFQFFDESMDPYKIIILFSSPHESIIKDNSKFQDYFEENDPEYLLSHRLVAFDENLDLVSEIRDYPAVSFENDLSPGRFIPSTSVFRIPDETDSETIKLFAQVINRSLLDFDYQNYHHSDLTTPPQIISAGSKIFEKRTNTFENTDQFMVSDVVFGYRSDFEINDDNELFIPFHVPKENVITNDLDLHILFEVYNIPRNDDGFYQFELTYEVVPERKGFMSRIFGGKSSQEQNITLTFDSEQPISKNHISVDISGYRSGKYILTLTLTNSKTDEELVRELNFEVVDQRP